MISDMISGPKSPITTKNAMQVPRRKPIMPISIANLPKLPKIWNARNSNVFLLHMIALLRRKWQASLEIILLNRRISVDKIMPH